MCKHSFLGFNDAGTCRQVCLDWKNGVDDFYQNTNFHCLDMKHGPVDFSDFVLKLPMDLVDINQIHVMELHPGCVSFGKKLTLLLRYDQGNNILFSSHQQEINALLRTVSRFWERFEHLEVRRADGTTEAELEHAAMQQRIQRDTQYIVVPFGQLGTDEKFRELNKFKILAERFDDFGKYIPFLHLITNLKKLTLLTGDNSINVRIMHRIPKTANLTHIYIGHHVEFSRGYWSMSCAVMYQHCAKSVTFLAGVTPVSISTMVDWINPTEGIGPVFEKLRELHILVDPRWTCSLADNMSAFTIASMFPVLTTLDFFVDKTHIQCDLWKYLGKFANKFPALKHLSFSGDCVPTWCPGLQTVCTDTHDRSSFMSNTRSVLKTFQLQCPIHLPIELMRMFPSLKHVIIEEWPERLQQYGSKANDSKYVKNFFGMFSNVASLSFFPVTTGDQTHACFRKVTHFRGDY